MGYRNKTYVIFDGDTDIYAYRFMKGWKVLEHLDFDFHDAHDLNVLTNTAGEETVKRKLRERLANTKQAIVLIGPNTKNLYRFVRWEIEAVIALEIPIIAVNLNGRREVDAERCPPILRGETAVHVDFKMKIIQYAMDNFPNEFATLRAQSSGDRVYGSSVYARLGL